jgi:predicted phage terminase large subunit-like protein
MTLSIDSLKISDLLNLKKKLLEDNLYLFVKDAWHVIEPSTKFVDNWHIEAICKYLKALIRGEIPSRNLIINIPPRTMKSILTNVMMPCWIWATQPEKKFIFTSYGEDLAIRDSVQCRKLLTSPWYQSKWNIELRKDQNQKGSFENTKGGYRKSFGFGGGVVGEGCDVLCIDDPIKPEDANSDPIRNTVNSTYDNTISTRLNDPKQGLKVLIMQRLHEDDLSGHLLGGKEPYEHLCLPQEYEGIRFVSSIGFVDPRKENGELLWPDRFGPKEVQSIKNTLTELGWAGQQMQRPSIISGNIFKKEWFANRIDNDDVVSRWISCDTSQSIKATADPNAIILAELRSDYRLFIRFVSNKRLEFTDLQSEVEQIATRYRNKLQAIIIESKSSGISLQQSISNTSPDWMKELVVPWNPTGDKVQRFYQAAVWCEKGCVLFPPPTENYPWLFDFEKEIFAVPNTRHDDQADSVSQLIIYLENALVEGLRYRQEKELV